MSSVDTRQVNRSSFFLFAEVEHNGRQHRLKVRNLSPGGMMADGDGLHVVRGERISVKLKNIDAIDSTVAWVEGSRFGVAFSEEIDPDLVRSNPGAATGETTPRFLRVPTAKFEAPDPAKLRKV